MFPISLLSINIIMKTISSKDIELHFTCIPAFQYKQGIHVTFKTSKCHSIKEAHMDVALGPGCLRLGPIFIQRHKHQRNMKGKNDELAHILSVSYYPTELLSPITSDSIQEYLLNIQWTILKYMTALLGPQSGCLKFTKKRFKMSPAKSSFTVLLHEVT